MKKFIKKNWKKILITMSICLTCCFALFSLTKTYAYTINEDGNLVGDNLLYIENGTYTIGNLTIEKNNGSITLNGSTSDNYVYYTLGNINFNSNETYFISGNGDNLQVYLDKSPYYTNNAFTGVSGTYNINIEILPNKTFNNTIYFPMVNLGNEKLEQWEPYGIYYSESNYEDMEEHYNNLLGNNPNAIYNAFYNNTIQLVDSNNINTIFAQDTMHPDTNTITFSQIEIPNIRNYLNNYDSENTTTYPTPYLALKININFQITNSLMFQYDNSTLDIIFTFKNTIANTEITEHRDTEYPYYSIQNKDKFAYNQIIYDGIYLPDYTTIDFNLSIDGVSYANGYQEGINSQQNYINILKQEKQQAINQLNNNITTLNNTIASLQAQYNELIERYNNITSGNNDLYSMVIAVADTPITIFKSIFNFDILGIDISNFIFGIISLLIIIWLIKKII